jgi:serine/threonine protein phosphatase PrpC/regulator of replication initiation timing
MRVTPTKEQLLYLMSIGVSPSTISPPSNATDNTPSSNLGVGLTVKTGGFPPSTTKRWSTNLGQFLRRFKKVWSWTANLMKALVPALALILISAQTISGQETTPIPTPTRSPTSVETKRKSQLASPQIVGLEHQLTQLQDGFRDLRTQVESLLSENRRLAVMNDALTSTLGGLDARLSAFEEKLSHMSGSLESMAALETKAKQTQEALERQAKVSAKDRSELTRAFGLALVSVTILLITLWLIGWLVMRRKLKQSEARLFGHLAELRHELGPRSGALEMHREPGHAEKHIEDVPENKAEPTTVAIQPQRPTAPPVPHPITQMSQIVEEARGSKCIEVKPDLPRGSWNLGLATVKGNVRSENQDYGLCFEIGGHQVLVVADGCGGLPHGQRAAYLSVLEAATSIIRTYGKAAKWLTPDPATAAAKAMHDASHCLAVEGDKLNIVDLRDGLRTTLIIVVGNRGELGYAYIGDGGGYVIHASGAIDQFLVPQKANQNILHVLAASLGPSMEGEPVVGKIPRFPGDLLLVGTDGIFDRVDGSFPKDVLKGAIQHNGDLQKVGELALCELAEFKDSAGYICDDNMALGLMGDGTQPKLSAGFWVTTFSSQHEQIPEDILATEKIEKQTFDPVQGVTS